MVLLLPHCCRHVLGYAYALAFTCTKSLLTTVRAHAYALCVLQLIALRTFSPALFTFLARRGLPVRRVRRVRPLLLALPAESHPQQAAEPGQGMRPPAAF